MDKLYRIPICNFDSLKSRFRYKGLMYSVRVMLITVLLSIPSFVHDYPYADKILNHLIAILIMSGFLFVLTISLKILHASNYSVNFLLELDRNLLIVRNINEESRNVFDLSKCLFKLKANGELVVKRKRINWWNLTSSCTIPPEIENFDEVLSIVSKYSSGNYTSSIPPIKN